MEKLSLNIFGANQSPLGRKEGKRYIDTFDLSTEI